MKKLVNISLLLFISACVPFSSIKNLAGSVSMKIKEVPIEMPRKVIINQDDSGLVVYNDSIYRINNLEITKNRIPLNDSKSDYGIGYVLSNEDEDFNNLIYSRALKKYGDIFLFSTFSFSAQFYTVKIPKKNPNVDVSKELFQDFGIQVNQDNNELSKINNNKYFFLLTNEIDSYAKRIVLKVMNKGILESYEIYNNKLLDRPVYNYEELYFPKVNVDEYGNGFFSYYENNRDFVIYELKNYQKQDSVYKEELSKSKYLLEPVKNTLDPTGTGFIVYIAKNKKRQPQKLLLNKFENFKKVEEKDLINMANKSLVDSKINKDGNGYLLIRNLKNKSETDILDTYIKKIVNFEIVETENQILDENQPFKGYYDSSINEKGDGLIIFNGATPELSKDFKIIKIRNYELSK